MIAPTNTTTTPEDLAMTTAELNAVKKAAKKLARKQAERDAAMAELAEAIRQADQAGGVTRNELIAASGLARQSVYDALKKPVAG